MLQRRIRPENQVAPSLRYWAMEVNNYKVGPLLVINGVITPIIRVITPGTNL